MSRSRITRYSTMRLGNGSTGAFSMPCTTWTGTALLDHISPLNGALRSTSMKMAVRRLDRDGRYVTSIARDDGVTFSMQGVGHNFAIPHDVAHYVVEKALGLDRGFWGSVADGAVFPSMTY